MIKRISDFIEGVCTFITISIISFILVFTVGLPIVAHMGIAMNLWHAFTLVGVVIVPFICLALYARCDRGVWPTQFNWDDLKFLYYEIKSV